MVNFSTIKKNYDRKLWSKAMVRTAVRKGIITADQYKEITGDAYGVNTAADIHSDYDKEVV